MTTATAPTLPLVLAEVTVLRVTRLSPCFVRVELGSPALADVGVDGPWLDQRVKLLFPGRSGRVRLPQPVDGSWYAAWAALPDDERGSMRTYTVRDVVGTGPDTRLVVDLVLHVAPGASGPGGEWASRAQVGDRLGLVAPRRGVPFGGIEFAPGDAERLLLAGDETAVPAVASILASLPADAAGTAFLEVPTPEDVLDLAAPSGVRVVWLPRAGAAYGDRLCRAVLALFGLDGACADPLDPVDPDLWETPSYSSSGEPLDPATAGPGEVAGGLYAWVAGESGTVTRLRRHLVREAGLHRRQVAFMGYWRQGVAMRG